jgi:hypothetical protein
MKFFCFLNPAVLWKEGEVLKILAEGGHYIPTGNVRQFCFLQTHHSWTGSFNQLFTLSRLALWFKPRTFHIKNFGQSIL